MTMNEDRKIGYHHDCLPDGYITEFTCPICETFYHTKDEAEDCFRACVGLNH